MCFCTIPSNGHTSLSTALVRSDNTVQYKCTSGNLYNTLYVFIGIPLETETGHTTVESIRASFWIRYDLTDITWVGIVMTIKGFGHLTISVNTTAAIHHENAVALLTMHETSSLDVNDASIKNIVCGNVVGDVRQLLVSRHTGGTLLVQVSVAIDCRVGDNGRQACATPPTLDELIFVADKASGCTSMRQLEVGRHA